MHRFRRTQGLRKDPGVSCYAQKLVHDVFGHKTDVAACYDPLQKVKARLELRTAPICGIKQNIGVDDESHRILFHDRFKRFSVGQIDSRPTHVEYRQAQRSFRVRSGSGSQTLGDELVDQIGHGPSLSSG
jgi:hypothetical protein